MRWHTLRGRELLREALGEVGLALFPRVEEVALPADAHHVVGRHRGHRRVELGLEREEHLVGLLGGRHVAERLVDKGGLRGEHPQLHLCTRRSSKRASGRAGEW